jgi:phosphoenolpyruvate carboxykinase (GTP)
MLGIEENKIGSDSNLFNNIRKGSKFLKELHLRNRVLEEKILVCITEYANLTGANTIKVIDGNEEEQITMDMVNQNLLIKLDQREYPNSYLYRSEPFDVARSEKDTYICTTGSKEDAGVTNYWMNTKDAMKIARENLKNSLKGKKLYVVPYWLGPLDSKFGQGGIEMTDSQYVVLNLMKITRVGLKTALPIAKSNSFVLGMHATANLNPEKRYIMHLPDENEKMGMIISFNTNYGGNALLSKKCHALRMANFKAKKEGWMAEHMMLIGVKDPSGATTYISGAFPSSSGKTNLSMLEPPDDYKKKGWDTFLISDDITWMNVVDGRLRGINPEFGFFGVVPHTSYDTNPRAMDAIKKDTLFTNVALDLKNRPYWEGLSDLPEFLIDWKGNTYTGNEKAAHPNSRFTTPIKNYKNLSQDYENPEGAPVSAFLFGGRRSDLLPLVMESKTWEEGVLYGAIQRIETTAASIGKVGELRNDPMAMRPFMPYNMGDYFQHYLDMGKRLKYPPKIYNVNWFRKDESGKFLWPGYSYNMRVIEWITGRVNNKIQEVVETPMGFVPSLKSFNRGVVKEDIMKSLFYIDKEGFIKELDTIKPFFESIGNRFPEELWKTFEKVRNELEHSK